MDNTDCNTEKLLPLQFESKSIINMSYIGKKAPQFEANAVINGNEIVERFSLEQFNGKKNVLLFFYPMDFSSVCPTEILAFQNKLEEFEKRNVAVIGCSVDSVNTHLAWLNTDIDKGGIKGVTFPLVSDFSKTISFNYDVLGGEYDYDEEEDEVVFEGNPFTYRALFLIDKMGIVRHQLINDLPFGRSIDEALRMVDQLRHYERHGESCPANWKNGDKGIVAPEATYSNFIEKHRND